MGASRESGQFRRRRSDLNFVFGRTCACRKLFDSSALGAFTSDRCHWWQGRSLPLEEDHRMMMESRSGPTET